MLACCLATILPAMSLAEVPEAIQIHSVASLTRGRTAFVTIPLWSAPTAADIQELPLSSPELRCGPVSSASPSPRRLLPWS
jgi:hypothetical protein